MKKIIVFNWKNKPATTKEAIILLKLLKKFLTKRTRYRFIICPPFIYLSLIKDILEKGYYLGAQNVFWLNRIAVTGEITPRMLRGLGVKYVIIGHSERRKYLYEDNQMINLKIKACLNNNLIPIVCIGNIVKNKVEGLTAQMKRLLLNQLNSIFKGIQLTPTERIILAYEPVWAIGKQQGENPEVVTEINSFLRLWLRKRFSEKISRTTSLLYGGSVKSYNILPYLSAKKVDGLLIGSASVQKQQLNQILKILANNKK